MHKVFTITGIAAMAIAAATSLAGCGTSEAGSAARAPSVATPVAVVTAESLSPPTTPPPTTAPAATVTATVLVQPPVNVVLAPPAITVVQPPVIDHPSPACTEDCGFDVTAEEQVAIDHSVAESTIGWWIPQLSSKQDGAGAMSRFNNLQRNYPDVFMVWSGDYSSFRSSDYYVAMVPREYATAGEANSWCDAQGFSADNCFAKRLSHIDGPDGNSVER